ncbi:hypothetical protein BJ170DRAFT_589979 [Xylariales sp. AK1849]|nr:hypothetical protein BJ170DRAFT_589979 [Xylariales sp. AK1849]
MLMWRGVTPAMVCIFFWRDGKPCQDDIIESLEKPLSLSHWMAWRYGIAIAESDCLDQWSGLMIAILGFCSPHRLHLGPKDIKYADGGDKFGFFSTLTLLFAFLSGVWNSCFEKVIRAQMCGFITRPESIIPRPVREQLGPRLVGFKFGPNIDDWDLDWDLDNERFAGDFWKLIEELADDDMPHLPGSWFDDSDTRNSEVCELYLSQDGSSGDDWSETSSDED